MRFTYLLGALALTLAFVLPAHRSEAQGLLHKHGQCADCDKAQQQTVTLPAQQIRIQTTRPQVIVNEVSGPSRMRGFYSQPHIMPMMPMMQGPFVATFPAGMTFHPANVGFGSSSGGSALDAIHALERQHLEFVRQKAALKAEMDHTDKVIQRVQSNISATLQTGGAGASGNEVNAALQQISTRLDAIEKLLIIHDNILQKKK